MVYNFGLVLHELHRKLHRIWNFFYSSSTTCYFECARDQLCHTRGSPCLQLKAPSSQNVPPRLGISNEISLPFQVFEVVTSHVLFTHSFLPRQILTCCSYVGLEISEYHDFFLQKCVLMRRFIWLALIILIRFTTYLWFQKIKHHQSRKKKKKGFKPFLRQTAISFNNIVARNGKINI